MTTHPTDETPGMTPEAQRIAIAEACGWTRVNWTVPRPEPWWTSGSPDDYAVTADDLPDYLNDLNAMHEAEKTLVQTVHYYAYYEKLYQMTGSCMAYGLSATAAQRAEAFLRTIGKWRP